MHVKAFVAAAIVGVSMLSGTAVAEMGDGTPPVLVDGARVVDIADTSGGISRYTTIPWSSVFRTHGGRGARCSFTSNLGGTTSDGQSYAAGQRVESEHWIFIEGTPPSFGEAPPVAPSVGRGPLVDAVRHFLVFCDSVYHLVGAIDVWSRDPMLDPRQRVDEVYHALQLERPVLWRDPVVNRWGGLVTRFPTWLAIGPSAWRAQRSNEVTWRGWSMYLVARPVALDHVVTFVPATSRSGVGTSTTVPCVDDGEVPIASAVSLPAVPDLPDVANPGVIGECTWSPPGPGTVTITPRITYDVTFWANSYTEALDQYVWTGVPVTYRTGDLTAVNTPG